MNMAKKTVSLSVEEKVYEEYRKYCEQKGIILSKQFENFMVEELNKNQIKTEGEVKDVRDFKSI